MPSLFKCLSGVYGESLSKLKRMHLGPSQKLTVNDKEWYVSAINHYKHNTQYGMFQPMPRTNVGAHPFCAWKVMLDMTKKWKTLKKKKVYLVQIGDFPDFLIQNGNKNSVNFFRILTNFLETYFPGLEIVSHKPLPEFFDEFQIASRNHELTGQKQYLVTDIQDHLTKFLPDDAMSIVALTWTDMYPAEDLNFVLGEASFEKNCAVFCFGRFEPKMVMKTGKCEDISSLTGDLVYRLIRVMTHETCHLFGLNHCVYYNCAMNASDSLELALSQPFFCCPFCLRKLQHVLNFTLNDYYATLHDLCSEIHAEIPSDFWLTALDHLKEIRSTFETHPF